MVDCITIEFGGITFGDLEPDGDGIIWSWTKLAGWWTPADPILSVIELAQGTEVCSSLRGPRHPTLDIYADTSANAAAYDAAIAQLAACEVLIDVPGPFIVHEPSPKQLTNCWLADAIDPQPVGAMVGDIQPGLACQIQLFAPDPTKVAVL